MEEIFVLTDKGKKQRIVKASYFIKKALQQKKNHIQPIYAKKGVNGDPITPPGWMVHQCLENTPDGVRSFVFVVYWDRQRKRAVLLTGRYSDFIIVQPVWNR